MANNVDSSEVRHEPERDRMKLLLQATAAAMLIVSAAAVLLEARHYRQCRCKPPCDCEYGWDIDWSGWPL